MMFNLLPWREQRKAEIKNQIYIGFFLPFFGLILLMLMISHYLNHCIHQYQNHDIELQKALDILHQQEQHLTYFKTKIIRYDQDMKQLNDWQQDRMAVLNHLNFFTKISNKTGHLTDLQFQDQTWQLKGIVLPPADIQQILQLFNSNKVQVIDLKTENNNNIYTIKMK